MISMYAAMSATAEHLNMVARAYCAQSPEGLQVHRRVVTIVDGRERETCKYCGNVKEHSPVRYIDGPDDGPLYAQAPWETPVTDEVPDGFHIE